MPMVFRTLLVLVFLLPSFSMAQTGSPVGVWKTIDDVSGKQRSIVRIVETNGELSGTVDMIFDRPGEDPEHLCDKCKGDLKNKPVIGMTILWGLKKKGDVWKGGNILDPDNGKTYGCKMELAANGTELNVRGFIGISLIGRSQTWYRME